MATVCTPVLAAIALGCGSGGGAEGETTAAAPRIESTVKDGARLSAPLVWSATPEALPRDDFVTFVVFRIDGQERWADDAAPYVFQGRTWRAGAEFLYPTTLAPGSHRLAVEATTARGRHLTTSVDVSVAAAERTPPGLTGSWRREVAARDLRRAGIPGGVHQPGAGGGDVTAGTWEIRFGPDHVVHVVGVDSRHYSATAFSASGDRHLVLMGPANDARLGERHRFCERPREASYRWAAHADSLTLRATSDEECPGRDAIMSGVWTRSP